MLRSLPTDLPALIALLALTTVLVSLATPATSQCTTQWLPGEPIAGVGGNVSDATLWDPDGPGPAATRLVVLGDFKTAGDIAADGAAMWDSGTGAWSPIALPFGSLVFEFEVAPDNSLVAIGYFPLNPAVRYLRVDGTSWSTIPGAPSVTSPVGRTQSGDWIVVANNLMQWDGTTWTTLGPAPNHTVSHIVELPGGDIVAGHQLTWNWSSHATGLSKWNGTSWTNIGPLMLFPGNANIHSLVVDSNGDLVMGGSFPEMSGIPNTRGLARWNGSLWSSLGAGVDDDVTGAIAMSNQDLFVVGRFDNAGNAPASRIARWDGTAWSPVGGGLDSKGAFGTLLEMPNGDLIAAGVEFLVAGNTPVSNIARWDGSNWHPLLNGAVSCRDNDHARAVATTPDGHILAAGNLRTTAGNGHKTQVRRWDGNTWSRMGEPITGFVQDLLISPTLGPVMGGEFTAVGTTQIDNVARWDGTAWVPIGGGVQSSIGFTSVRSLGLLPSGDLVVAGRFDQAGSVSVNGIARWDGTAWSPMASPSMDIGVMQVFPNGDLGLVEASQPGFRDVWLLNGSGLTHVGTANDDVFALAMTHNGNLIAGGDFTTIGGYSAQRVARWDGSFWWPISINSSGSVYSLLVLPNGNLLAGGRAFWSFTSTFHLLRHNGSTWSAIQPVVGGSDIPSVLDMTSHPDGDIVVAGQFKRAGNHPNAFVARLATTCPAAVVNLQGGCPSSGGSNELTAGLPWLESTWSATGTGLPTSSVVAFVNSFAPISIPLANLLPQGAPGCSLLVSPDLVDLLLPSGGTAVGTLALPNSPSLVGGVFYSQMVPFEFDPTLTITSITATNALAATIGSF